MPFEEYMILLHLILNSLMKKALSFKKITSV